MLQIALAFLLISPITHAAEKAQPVISEDPNHKLTYRIESNGDRVPDFSSAGYHGGDSAIPELPVRMVVAPIEGDNTARIQSAIDYVASLPADARGAVLLSPGRFEVAGGLRISTSGIVLRGSGIGKGGTLLLATGHDRRTLVTIAGKNDRTIESNSIAIADDYVPVNSTRIKLKSAGNLKKGDTILVRRPSTIEWIKRLGMTDVGGGIGLGWKPGTRDLSWDRTLANVEGDEVSIDAPITTGIDAKLGGGNVAAYTWAGRITEVGVENLRCESTFDSANPKDEAHSWFAVTMENVQDAWVRQISASHFSGGAVALWDTTKRVTVEDCKSYEPISEIAGQRRHTFFTNGQQTLFQRCWSEFGRHDFSVGFCAAGPNAFVQCEAANPLDDSGPLDSWASGVLYDNVRVDGNALTLGNRGHHAAFAGWAAANSMAWNCYASVITCAAPPGAMNWSVGCWGQFEGNGTWEDVNGYVHPTSLYYAQLSERLGADTMKRADWMMVPNDASSSPTVEQAARLIAASTEPAPQLANWIDRAGQRRAISVDESGAKKIEELAPRIAKPQAGKQSISIVNGRIVCDGKLVTGKRTEGAWWRGGVRPSDLQNPLDCITRFVPGRTGPGLTDDLNELMDSLIARGVCAFEHHYALWYDRRDDDHERVRRMDGDAWPPFYELPFARSGKEQAWDGLSKYDLTKYNPWYFDRVREFANLSDQKGFVLIQDHFFQHNIIEAGAHWASCPWRSANNINNTGFPEPPPYAGDKRIFMAEQWYDLNNTTRREIYRAYIRKVLDNTAENTNVIHQTMDEFTGPLSFMQFWVDTVAEWEKETGKHPIISLSAPKDVQDAILADPLRSKIVSVIDIQYWWYQSDGEPYAPPGGKSLAPRQWERVLKHKPTSSEQVARAVKEYREKYPDKAVICSGNAFDNFGPAQLSAGASLPPNRK